MSASEGLEKARDGGQAVGGTQFGRAAADCCFWCRSGSLGDAMKIVLLSYAVVAVVFHVPSLLSNARPRAYIPRAHPSTRAAYPSHLRRSPRVHRGFVETKPQLQAGLTRRTEILWRQTSYAQLPIVASRPVASALLPRKFCWLQRHGCYIGTASKLWCRPCRTLVELYVGSGGWHVGLD